MGSIRTLITAEATIHTTDGTILTIEIITSTVTITVIITGIHSACWLRESDKSTKHQPPNPRETPKLKLQNSTQRVWFELGLVLGFGFWILGFAAWCFAAPLRVDTPVRRP